MLPKKIDKNYWKELEHITLFVSTEVIKGIINEEKKKCGSK